MQSPVVGVLNYGRIVDGSKQALAANVVFYPTWSVKENKACQYSQATLKLVELHNKIRPMSYVKPLEIY